jgi:nicotinamidase-related amidase
MPDADSLPHVSIADLADYLAPSRTALIVVDIQVDFASAWGVLGGYGVDMTEAEVVVDRIEEMIAAARKARVTVGFMRVMTRPETDSDALRTWMARRGTPGGEAICRIGSGEAYYRVTPEPGDIEIEKLAYSSFHGTDLDAQLRARGIDTLVIAGISTDCCVDRPRATRSTTISAFVVSDACTAYGDDLHYAALKAMSLHCALLTRTADVVAAWDKA